MKIHNTNFRKLITSYLMVLLLPITLSFFAYCIYLNAYSDSKVELYKQNLSRNISVINDVFSSLERYTYQLSQDTIINQLINSDSDKGIDSGTMLNIGNYIPSYRTFSIATNNYITHALVFFDINGIILYDSSVYMSGYWLNDYIIYDHSMTEWNKVIDSMKGAEYPVARISSIGVTGEDHLIYFATIPMGYNESPRATTILCLDSEMFIRQLLTGFESIDVYIHVTNSAGNVLLSTMQNVEFNKKTQTQVTLKSTYNDWIYTWTLPNAFIKSQVFYMRNILMISSAVIVIIGISIAMLFAYQRNKPILEITNILKKDTPYNSDHPYDEYDRIKGSIKLLVETQKSLEGKLRQNSELVKAYVLDKLLSGKYRDNEEMYALSTQIGLTESDKGYIVLIIQIVGYPTDINKITDVQIQQSVLITFISSTFPSSIIHKSDINRIIIIMKNPDEIEKYINRLNDLLNEKGHTNVTIGVGKVCKNITEIYLSYQSADVAIMRGRRGGTIVYNTHTESNMSDKLCYSADDELRIINLVHVGNTTECLATLDKAYWNNSKENNRPEYITRLFISDITATLAKIEMIDEDKRMQDMSVDLGLQISMIKNMDNASAFAQIRSCYEKICSHYACNRREWTDILIKSIINYIEKFYMNQNISLTTLAEHFNLTETYLSSLFKEHTDENISSFLERVRMNHAHLLLTETNISVDNIAVSVGYSSGDTFRRAFKRFHGISPTAYRISTKNQ